MKAAFVVAPRTYEVREVPTPQITDSQMLVKIEACGVCSSDMTGYKDTWSDEMKQANPFPRRAGHEPAGTVVEVGKLVKGFQVGDRITGYFADDAYCEYVAVDPTTFAAHRGHGYVIEKIPDGIPFEHALGEPLMSCMSIARTTTPEFGDYVFQIGAGFMGLGIIAGVASPKLREYIVTDLDDTRLELAREMGATITLNPSKVDVVEEVEDRQGPRCRRGHRSGRASDEHQGDRRRDRDQPGQTHPGRVASGAQHLRTVQLDRVPHHLQPPGDRHVDRPPERARAGHVGAGEGHLPWTSWLRTHTGWRTSARPSRTTWA